MRGDVCGEAPVSLSVIGTWKLTDRDREIVLPSRKARDLLTFLVLSDLGSHPRATLAETFWPFSAPDLARASLRHAVYVTSRALSEQGLVLLEVQPETVGLIAGRINTDIDRLRGRLAAGQVTTADCQVIETLSSGLLRSFADTGPALQDWLRETRGRLLAAVQADLNTALARADLPAELRLRLARAGLALDEFNEVAARSIMSCLLETGNAAAALRFYGSFHERLGEELDAEPSIETQDLAVRIKQMQPATPAEAAGPPPPVGRDHPGAVVAVLPFDFLGADATPPHIVLGLLDQITCHMAGFSAPAVISSNSTRGFLGQVPGIADIRRTLGADYIVTGSVMVHGGQARVQVQLAESTRGIVRWAQVFHAPQGALFDLQATIAEKIANAVVPSVDLIELRRIEHQSLDRLEPYHLVLRAKELILRFERTALAAAGELLAEAERKDPGFGPMHALRAEWHALRLWQGWSDAPEAECDALETHALRAIAASPSNGRSLALLGHCRTMLGHRHDEALRLFERALEVCPNDAETLAWTVPTLSFCDETARAAVHGEKSIALSPLDPFLFRNQHFLAIAHYAAGNVERAAELGLASHARAPDYMSNLRMTIAALVACGRAGETAALVQRHNRLEPGFSVHALVPRIGFRRHEIRDVYARQLIAAGLPA